MTKLRAGKVPRGFTLIELLVVVSIIALLIAILLPSLQRARGQARATVCLTNIRTISHGWHMYADQYGDMGVPHKPASETGGLTNPNNWYEVVNGLKYRPSWVATMGKQVGLAAFDGGDLSAAQAGTSPEPADRLNFTGKVYLCPDVPEWTDERNAATGYNYQFLGNARKKMGKYVNFPVNRSRIKSFAGTVLAADVMGTAAGFARAARLPYQNNGTAFEALGNHAYTLDPPRLTALSDKGTGDVGSPRTGVDPRHLNRVNTVFCDGHGEQRTVEDLGYRLDADGKFYDEGPSAGPAHNRLFSGTGNDDDPPPLPM